MAREFDLHPQVQGDSVPFVFTFKDGTGAALNLTGALVSMTIRSSLDGDDSSAVLVKDVSSHDDAVNGATSFTVSKEEAAALIGEYYYDVQIIWANGKCNTILKGVIEFTWQATKRTSAI